MSPLPLSDFLDAVAKATLVLGATGLVVRALRQSSAATRHFLWMLGVAAALLLPSARALAPRWDLPLLPAFTPAAAETTPEVLPAAAKEGEASVSPAAPEPALPPAVVLRARQAEPLARSGGGVTIDPPRLLLAGWVVGLLAVAVPFVAGAFRVAWLRRRAVALDSPAWTDLRDEISRALALDRNVALLRGGSASMPMAFGVFRPAVLLPAGSSDWPEARRRAVLTHELAHVKRHDCLTQAIAHAACAVYWFHPLAWLAARRLQVERERACDDLVLGAGASGPDYADDLLHLARVARGNGGFAFSAVAMARPSQLEGRLLAILDPSRKRRGPSRFATAAAAVVAALLMVGLAGVQPWVRPAKAAAPAVALVAYAGADEELPAIAAAPAAAAEPEARPHPAPVAASAAEEADEDAEAAPDEAAPLSADRAKVAAALAGALHDTDSEVRQQAVFSLGQMRAQSAAPALVTALSDADSEVRAQAAFALGQIRASSAVDGLALATKDKDAEVRQQAVFALGQIRDPKAVASLHTALADAEAEVRGQAVFALGQIRSEESVGPLIQALKDPASEVREQAAFALGQLRDPKASEALTAALKDKEPEVRRQAAFALGQLIE